MAITHLDFTLCVSTRRLEVGELVRLAGQAASRMSVATAARDDHRVFWEFRGTAGRSFDEAYPAAVEWAVSLSSSLTSLEDAAVSLWCTIHADTEFVGLNLRGEQLRTLGSNHIDLVISSYAQGSNDQ